MKFLTAIPIHPITRRGLWFVRLGVLWWLLNNALMPPPPYATLDSPQDVITDHPLVCVHTRLIDEVYEWKIQRSLQLVREMGATSIVEFFPWAYFEPQKRQYDWGRADIIVRHAQNQGLHIIARIGFVPSWAKPNSSDFSTLNYLPDDAFDDFANFVATFATRYAGTIDDIIIWNEPNLAFEWGYGTVDPAKYVALLKTVYPVAKQANPKLTLLAGALAPTLEPKGSPNGMNDLLYLEEMYQAGAKSFFDALAIHTYGFTSPTDEAPSDTSLNYRRAELLHDIMAQYGDKDKPVYITESGWNDHPRWTKAVRPSQRVQYTIQSFMWAEQHWHWAKKVCIWVFRYPAPTFSYPDNFTFAGTNFELKPIYFAVQEYTQGKETSGTLWLPQPVEP